MTDVKERVKIYLELCNIKISLAVAFTSAAGFLLASPEPDMRALVLAAGVFFLSCGSRALNQYQERDIDALMTRTWERPIPAGKIKPSNALFFSLAVMGLGLYATYTAGGFIASALGLCAVIWYNAIYTCLKRKTAFAAVPGAFIGAVPPLIGWITGGGHILNTKALFFCFFVFMWQVPHFWLLLLLYSEDYERAGLPSLTGVFTLTQLFRIIRQWIFCALLSGLLLALHDMTFTILKISILLSSCWLLYREMHLLQGNEIKRSRSFARLNLYMTTVLFLISLDKLALRGMPEWIRQAFG
jgi:protoheme IX farnesyltransferase